MDENLKQSQENEEEIEIIDEQEQENNETEENIDIQQEIENDALAKLEEENTQLQERYLRLQAEYNNFKKRTQKEREAARKYQSQDVVAELLPALDNFKRALEVEKTEGNTALYDGITMVYRQLEDALEAQGVERMETVGQPFDPNLHHAVMQVEEEGTEENTVIEELQSGYMLKDRVIRPAMVKVNK